jgi:predicted permease
MKNELIFVFIIAICCNLLLILLPYPIRRLLKLTAVEQASLSYPNCGEILIPLVVAVLSEEMSVYCCAFMIVQIFFLFTHGVGLLGGQGKMNLKAIFKNPNVIAMVLAFLMFAFRVRMPEFLYDTVEGFQGMLLPACMLVIGIAIGNSDLKFVLSNKRNYLICFIRLIAMPIIVLLLIKLSGVAYVMDGAKNIILIVFMATASSSAATVANIAQSYSNDAQNAGIINVMSILFLIITLPIMVILYQLWI